MKRPLLALSNHSDQDKPDTARETNIDAHYANPKPATTERATRVQQNLACNLHLAISKLMPPGAEEKEGRPHLRTVSSTAPPREYICVVYSSCGRRRDKNLTTYITNLAAVALRRNGLSVRTLSYHGIHIQITSLMFRLVVIRQLCQTLVRKTC